MKQNWTIIGLIVALLPAQAGAAPLSGFSIGAQGGIVERSGSTSIAGRSLRGTESDAAYGAFVGYDLPVGAMVVGAQAEINRGSGIVRADDGAGTFNDFDPKWGYALSTRAGVLATSKLLVYGRLGYAAERVTEIFGGPTILVLAAPPKARWLSGVQFGGGTEFSVSSNSSIRAEYRRNEYSSRYKSSQFLAGAAFRF